MKLRKLAAVFAAMSVLLAGCAQKGDTESSSTGKKETDNKIVIEHAFGKTVLDKKPERIVTISWGNHDVPLALSVVPVGISEANYGVSDGSGMLPWTKKAFEELKVEKPNLFKDTDGLDYEAISDANPDVILAAYSGITEEEYELLSEIAPVVAYQGAAWQTFWRDQIKLDSKGMGMEKEGNELVKELETLIEEKKNEYTAIKGKTVAFCYFSQADLSSFYVYLPDDPRAAYLTDLGFEVSSSVLKLAEENESFAVSISSEKAELLKDVDVIVAYGDDKLLEAMQKDSLLSTIPAIKNGAVALIEDGTPLAASATPSALSIPATIDEYLSILSKAAEKVNE